MSSIGDLLVTSFFTGLGASIGSFVSNRYLLRHLDRLESKRKGP